MFYDGIDIAKNYYEVAILSESGKLIGTTLKIANSTTGAQKLLNGLVKAGMPSDDANIGMEATEHYWLAMSKRGLTYLRQALYTVAGVAALHDSALSAYYERLRKQNTYPGIAVGSIARKLCYIVYGVLTENRPYEQRLYNAAL